MDVRAPLAAFVVCACSSAPRDVDGEGGLPSPTPAETGSTSIAETTSGAGRPDGTSTDDGIAKLDLAVPDLGGSHTACPCAAGTDLVLLLSAHGELWTFDPTTVAFERLGALDCPVFSSTSFSLALDHLGQAFVEFEATGDIFTVDLDDLACTDPGYTPPASEPRRFGLGFVADPTESACEIMLGWSFDGAGWSEGPGVGRLVRFTGTSLVASVLAEIDFNGGELAATGDGRVLAFTGAPQAAIVEIERDTGEVIDRIDLPGVALTDAFGVASWGGDVYLFVAGDGDSSEVLRLDLDDSEGAGQHVAAVGPAPILVVGAATSTCAPTEPAG